MLFGKVKNYLPANSYGFIVRDDSNGDVFYHQMELERCGLSELKPGQRVSFDVIPNRNDPSKFRATNITLIG